MCLRMIWPPDSPAARELSRLLRDAVPRMAYASAGEGTVPHFAAELFQLQTGTKLQRVEFSGAGPAIAEVANGVVQLMFPSAFTALPYLRSGQLKALAVAGPERIPLLPDVPTLVEAGVPGVEMSQWYALFAPAKTPPTVVRQLNASVNQVLQDPDIAARMEAAGARIQLSTPGELHDLLMAESERWHTVVLHAGLKPDTQTE